MHGNVIGAAVHANKAARLGSTAAVLSPKVQRPVVVQKVVTVAPPQPAVVNMPMATSTAQPVPIMPTATAVAVPVVAVEPPQLVDVTCPAGVLPGQEILVDTHKGRVRVA